MEVGEIGDWVWKHVLGVRPWLATTCAVLVVAYVALLGIGRLFDVWRSFRTRRAILEEEKIVNEILKIRYEIEVLRKQHDLPDLTLTEQPSPTGASRVHPRFRVSLPEVPSFSFSPVLSLFKISLRRPDSGTPRAYWALKLLALVFLAFIALAVLVIALAPTGGPQDTAGGPQGTAGAILVMVTGAVASYLLCIVVYNLIRAALSALSRARAIRHA
jgi:hypothetical protein